MKFLRTIGIGVTVIYILSFFLLFAISPQAYAELEYLGLTAFNLNGFSHRLQVVLINYITVGLLIMLFGGLLATKLRQNQISRYGSYLIVLSGLAWASFGIFPMNTEGGNEIFGLAHMIKITVCWLSGIIGLVLISVDLNKGFQPDILRWITLTAALLMVLESLYFMINDYSGRVSAFAWTIYMLWFSIFSLVGVPKMRTSVH